MARWRFILLMGLAVLVISGCAPQGAALQGGAMVAQAATRTPPPPGIPTTIPRTSTATITATASLIPTATLTHTPRPTATIRPTATMRPTRTPTEPPTETPLPTLAEAAAIALPADPGAVYTVKISNVLPSLRNVYVHGLAAGRNTRRFSKIGDCQVTSASFLQSIDRGFYKLGDYGYLQSAIDHFNGSFRRVGPTGVDGMKMDNMLDPQWTNPELCGEDESRVECEFRLHNPAVVFIYIQPRLGNNWAQLYHDSLTRGVQMALDRGIIPILSTHINWEGHEKITEETNRVVNLVAAEMGVPVWDFNASTRNLPHGGDNGNWHMNISPHGSMDFTDPRNFQYAMTIRNLEALQVLDIILRQVMY